MAWPSRSEATRNRLSLIVTSRWRYAAPRASDTLARVPSREGLRTKQELTSGRAVVEMNSYRSLHGSVESR